MVTCEVGNPSLETHHDNDQNAIVEKLQTLDFKDNDEVKEKEDVKTPKYPLRSNVVCCAFYLKTGTCKFGFNCRFNHPPNRVFMAVGDKEKGNDESNGFVHDSDKIECKYFSTPEGCNIGDACKYSHSTEKTETKGPKLNFLGLPIRPLEKECTFYMRNGTCGYGVNCRFHHPDPISENESDGNTLTNGYSLTGDKSSHKTYETLHSPDVSRETLPKQSNGINLRNNLPYGANTDSYHQGMPWISERDQNQVTMSLNKPSFPHHIAKTTDPATHYESLMQIEEFPERPDQPDCDYFMRTGDCKYRSACRYNHPLSRARKLRLPSVSAKGSYSRSAKILPVDSTEMPNGNSNNTRKNGEPHRHQHMQQKGDFPERPGQPECEFFMKNGDCKYRSACRYHHPRNRVSTSSPFTLNEKGLPLRPDGRICRNYEQHGTCKYGSNCQFHHPDIDSSSVLNVAPQDQYQNSTDVEDVGNSEIPASDNADSEWGDTWVM